ncbi:MAG: putative membrane protein YedE/YeeE [Gammaproteobacteria bacterium]
MENFTPVPAFAGGLLIGLSAIIMLLFNGRITGVSGILDGIVVNSKSGDRLWRICFLAGLVLGGFIFNMIWPDAFVPRDRFSLPLLVAGGFIVGIGTRMGSGCTSGHGICGIARFSRRSILATVVFMLSGGITVYLIRHVVFL